MVEMRKTDGKEYPCNTLHHIVAGLQRYLHYKGKTVDLFKDLKKSRRGIKCLQAKGVGGRKCQTEVITPEEEQKLWQTGQLGDSNPQQLLNTIVYCC